MVDLSSREHQATFKKIRLISTVTNAFMLIIAALSAGLAGWVAVQKAMLKVIEWSEIVYIILLAAIAAYFIFLILWKIRTRGPYRAVMHIFVAERFKEHPELFGGGDAEFEIMLAGDKLTVMRRGCESLVQLVCSRLKNLRACVPMQ